MIDHPFAGQDDVGCPHTRSTHHAGGAACARFGRCGRRSAAPVQFIGPAVVASVADVDPGNFATHIQAGAQHGPAVGGGVGQSGGHSGAGAVGQAGHRLRAAPTTSQRPTAPSPRCSAQAQRGCSGASAAGQRPVQRRRRHDGGVGGAVLRRSLCPGAVAAVCRQPPRHGRSRPPPGAVARGMGGVIVVLNACLLILLMR